MGQLAGKKDLTDPEIAFLNVKNKSITKINVRELGIYGNFICNGSFIYLHVIRDTYNAKADDDMFENVFVINVMDNICSNVTNNSIGNESSLIGVRYDYLKQKNGYISFFSSENTNPNTRENIYKEFYYLKQ